MIFKSETNSIEKNKNTVALLYNNRGVICFKTINEHNTKPCEGLYISNIGNLSYMLVPTICETLKYDNNTINLMHYHTSEEKDEGTQYLKNVDVSDTMCMEYDMPCANILKSYILHPEMEIVCVKYIIKNKTNKSIVFNATPMYTMRMLNETKRASTMKYSCQKLDEATYKTVLSISDNVNIYTKVMGGKIKEKDTFVYGIHLDSLQSNQSIKTYTGDLYTPYMSETNVKANSTAQVIIYLSTENIQNQKLSIEEIEKSSAISYSDKICGVDEKFHELRGLTNFAYSFYNIDVMNKKLSLIDELPKMNNNKLSLIHAIMSVEGNYLKLKRYKEAKKILETIMNKLNQDDFNGELENCEAFLMFAEAVNRYYHDSDCKFCEIKSMYEYIKQTMYFYISNAGNKTTMDSNFMLQVEGKTYIRINAMWYNALKILNQFMESAMENSDNVYEIASCLRENVIAKFYCDETKSLKYELNETTACANSDMLYTMCLSFPMINESIGMKVIDTCFKELYTPLGMRKFSVDSELYDGYVYPHLMVCFLKANLRQMGVTRATQKIGYNLVKELLQEINKNIVGGICYRYSDKTKLPDTNTIMAITNAECIRLYNMLM